MHNSPLNRPFQARLLQLSLFTASTLLKLNAYKQFRTLLPAQSRKLPKHHHITPVLKSVHWLKIPQRIHYRIASLTYNTLQISQPSYIRQLLTIQPPGSTRSSSYLSLSRPPVSSSLKFCNRFFAYSLERTPKGPPSICTSS